VNEKYSSEDVDFFATTYQNKCYLIPQNECGVAKKLRFAPPVNG